MLQHLRVRCLEGVGFYTRSSTLVRGRMGHRFMFIDGDKAVSGSYRSVKIDVCFSKEQNKDFKGPMLRKIPLFPLALFFFPSKHADIIGFFFA